MDIQKTVLVVDDSTTNRSILCDILHSDYTVIQAENGIQAFTKLKKQDKKVDAIILDIIMPEMEHLHPLWLWLKLFILRMVYQWMKTKIMIIVSDTLLK